MQKHLLNTIETYRTLGNNHKFNIGWILQSFKQLFAFWVNKYKHKIEILVKNNKFWE